MVEAMRTYSDRAEMDERYERTVVQLMESQAYRELAAAHLFGAGLAFAPELRWIKFMTWHIREEVEHFEAVARMYRAFTGRDVTPVAMERLTARPVDPVDSWFELAMAQFLFDRGGFWQLREYESCTFLPYRQVIAKIIDEESGHQGLGERIVVELARTGRYEERQQRDFAKWLRHGLLSFGRPGTEGNRYAIQVGIKKRDSGEVMQDYLDDIKPAVKACGLTFPSAEALGLEMPDWINWSLDGVHASSAGRWQAPERLVLE
jgi:1,2-phenylacetyl-CoA epoxidase catalytic subunit